MLVFVYSALVLQQMLKGQPPKESILATGYEWEVGDLKALASRDFSSEVTWWVRIKSSPC